ncbi:MAG: hypothetical protein WBO70_02225 [Erysipelotrichaceae bacterium]
MNNGWIEIVVGIGLVLYGGYTLYKYLINFKNHLNACKKFKETNKNFQVLNYATLFVVVFILLAIYAIYACVTVKSGEQEFIFRCAFIFMAIIMVGMSVEMYIKKRCLLGEDSFVYDEEIIRFRSIMSMNPLKKWPHNIDITTGKQAHVVIPNKIGVKVHDAMEEYRKNKKGKNND